MTASPGPHICAKTRARETPGGPSGVAEAPTECFVGGVRPGCVGGREQGGPVEEQCRSSGSSLTQQMLSSCCEDARLVGSPFVCVCVCVCGGWGGGPQREGGGGVKRATLSAVILHNAGSSILELTAEDIQLDCACHSAACDCAAPGLLCSAVAAGEEWSSTLSFCVVLHLRRPLPLLLCVCFVFFCPLSN